MKDYQYTPLYYGTPCQVRFYEPIDGKYRGGIAYHNFIICGCCGATMLIDDVVNDAAALGVHWDDAVIELEWLDIEEAIRGD